MPIPASAQPAINALNTLAHNSMMRAPKTEQTKNKRAAKKKIQSLSKKNKKWAIILSYIAAGATTAAVAYAAKERITIPAGLKSLGESIRTYIGTSVDFKALAKRLGKQNATTTSKWGIFKRTVAAPNHWTDPMVRFFNTAKR